MSTYGTGSSRAASKSRQTLTLLGPRHRPMRSFQPIALLRRSPIRQITVCMPMALKMPCRMGATASWIC
jgi:hypothetical protein